MKKNTKRRCLQINSIERNIYVRGEAITEPIDYVRLTNALPIVFHFRDFDIPSGATAQAFCMVADGTGTQTDATISGNDVTIPVQKTMFSVLGHAALQVKITSGDDELVNFVCPVFVKPNYTEGDFPPSENTGGFFDEAKQVLADAAEAVEGAQNAVNQAGQAVSNANQAVEDAQQAVSNANQAAQNANNAASGVDEKVGQAVADAMTTEAMQPAINNYFEQNPVTFDATPTLDGTTLVFPSGITPAQIGDIQQDVADLQEFAALFDGKTLYTKEV